MSDQKGRVLVVDDEEGMRVGCQRILESEGCSVVTAESGEQALELFSPGKFDLALIDLKMPGMSGIELLARLNELDPACVYVIVTAYATLETAVQATKSGAYDYVAKPFTPAELMVVVDKALALHWLRQEAADARAEAERNLLLVATEQSRTRTIIQSMADGVMVTNREGNLVLYNPALQRLLGIKQELPTLGERPSPEVFGEELLALMLEASGSEAATMVSRELSGGPPNLAASIAPIRVEDGEPLGLVTVIRDITEVKSVQQRMSDFVSLVAHELRSPLGAVAQYLDVMLGGVTAGDPEKERQILQRCRERTGALSQLVRDLLDLSRLQHSGQVERTLAPLDLAEILRETVSFASQPAKTRNVSVSLEMSPELPMVQADRDEMVRLFANLVDNAIKYNREGGKVQVSAQQAGAYVVVEVSDTGVGIPQGAIERLGEAFYRVRTKATMQITGTGLGLSICKQIVDAHHGHIEIESVEGTGSTFRILLPSTGASGKAPVGQE
ncbi:MAG: response regulator [Armatimonadetes bacterium]|nr:response regulator [Armatimonadota bacterium]